MEASPEPHLIAQSDKSPATGRAPGAKADVIFKSSKVPQAKKAAISNNWLILWQIKANFDLFS